MWKRIQTKNYKKKITICFSNYERQFHPPFKKKTGKKKQHVTTQAYVEQLTVSDGPKVDLSVFTVDWGGAGTWSRTGTRTRQVVLSRGRWMWTRPGAGPRARLRAGLWTRFGTRLWPRFGARLWARLWARLGAGGGSGCSLPPSWGLLVGGATGGPGAASGAVAAPGATLGAGVAPGSGAALAAAVERSFVGFNQCKYAACVTIINNPSNDNL